MRGSHIWEKARLRVDKLHRKIARRRADFLHKLSGELVDRADLLVFEKLDVQGLAHNPHLSKSIMDASWGELVGLCSYEAWSAGGSVVLVDPRGTSQLCSGCGSMVGKSLSERVHRCPSCGLVLDRNLNAAMNILKRVGRGTPESTPVKTGPTPVFRWRASPAFEAGSPGVGRMSLENTLPWLMLSIAVRGKSARCGRFLFERSGYPI